MSNHMLHINAVSAYLPGASLAWPLLKINHSPDTRLSVLQVDQFQAVVPFEDQFSSLYAALRVHMQQDPNEYKVRRRSRGAGFFREAVFDNCNKMVKNPRQQTLCPLIGNVYFPAHKQLCYDDRPNGVQQRARKT